MAITKQINIIPDDSWQRIHVSQGDIGRTLQFVLYEGSTSYTIPTGATVKIQGVKPSGLGFSETCTWSGSTVTIDTTEAMTQEFGGIPTEIQITDGTDVLGTTNFLLIVERNPHPDTTTDGSMETIIPELTLLVNEVKGYAEEIEGTYHAYGSPWVASTVAQMTDTDKIYVYTGSETGYVNGNWYYYNGSSWVSGGVYNSIAVQTDKTLSIEDMPADAKVVGDEVGELKSDLSDIEISLGQENIGNLIMSATAGTIYRYNSSTGVIYTQENASYMCAVIDVSGLSYVTSTRNFGSSNYQFFGTETSFIATASSCRTSDAGYVFAVPSTATKLYLSFELSTWNIAVIEGRTEISSKTISDYPIGGTWIFDGYNTVTKHANLAYDGIVSTTTINTQYLDNDTKEVGYYYSNDQKVESSSYAVYAPVTVPKGTYYIGAVASTNFSYVKVGSVFSKLSDLNPISLSEYANLVVTVNDEATFYITASSTSTYKALISTIPMKPNDDEYVYGNFLQSPNKVIYVGTTRAYKTIKSALEAVEDVFDAYIYVDAETFDLVNEFGQSYLDAYSTAEAFGLFLKNRVHLIFASGSKVTFNYTGSNAYVHEYFSPFNAGRYGFELIGANIESTNCRYSVHDEHGTENEPYRNIYKGCTMKHDSSATTWGAHQCIGGGLGLHGTIEISDCVFEAIGTNIDASYHAPNTSSNAQNRVSVDNSYFAGTFRMSTYGTGIAKSYGYVKGNSCTSAPFVSHNEGSADNVEMIAWNNEIRS